VAYLTKKMKDLMPPGALPKEIADAIKRLEAGEASDKLDADLGEALDNIVGRNPRNLEPQPVLA
jgi:hypothetical protein